MVYRAIGRILDAAIGFPEEMGVVVGAGIEVGAVRTDADFSKETGHSQRDEGRCTLFAADTGSPAFWAASCSMSAVTCRLRPSPTSSRASTSRCRVTRTPPRISQLRAATSGSCVFMIGFPWFANDKYRHFCELFATCRTSSLQCLDQGLKVLVRASVKPLCRDWTRR